MYHSTNELKTNASVPSFNTKTSVSTHAFEHTQKALPSKEPFGARKRMLFNTEK